jgi:predicted Ser/Thr protein kinase
MSSDSLPRIGDLPENELLHVEEQCNRFEDAWKAWPRRPRPSLEEYLAGVTGPAFTVLLCELLHLELAYRRRHHEVPTLAEYLPRIPDREPLLREVFAGMGLLESVAPPSVTVTLPPGNIVPGSQQAEAAAPAGSGSRAEVSIPGYEVLGELGKGAMGVVYKACEISLNRLVALKMIKDDFPDEQERERFRREAKAVARLEHPNIVRVYRFEEPEAGRPYFVMELVEGSDLAKRLDAGPLAPREAAELVEVLARAVHHAHQCGIVHRDLKPGNVLLTAARTPKVSDFGLAKHLDLQTSLAPSGAVIGTPSYMAPEQAGGKTKQVGPAADVYALGVILYECLTGRPPFRAATLLETLEQVCTQEPVPVRQLQPRTPRDLEIVCLKCLEKDARHRYPSAEALADDLSRYRQGEPIRELPGVWDWLRHALRTRPPPSASYSWITLVWYGLIAILVHAAVFGLVQAGQPVGWIWAA